MDSMKGRTPTTIIEKTDHDETAGYQFVELIGGNSAGQTVGVHLEQAEHTTPQGEKYHRINNHRFAAESMLAGAFGGGRK